jgi:hypothetical protein
VWPRSARVAYQMPCETIHVMSTLRSTRSVSFSFGRAGQERRHNLAPLAQKREIGNDSDVQLAGKLLELCRSRDQFCDGPRKRFMSNVEVYLKANHDGRYTRAQAFVRYSG